MLVLLFDYEPGTSNGDLPETGLSRAVRKRGRPADEHAQECGAALPSGGSDEGV
jgi:hypothetical protein